MKNVKSLTNTLLALVFLQYYLVIPKKPTAVVAMTDRPITGGGNIALLNIN